LFFFFFFFFESVCWFCQNMFLAGHRAIRTSWLKFTPLQECKNNPFHLVLSYCAKQNGVDRNVFFISLNDCKDRYFETHDILCCFYIFFIIYLNRDSAVDTEITLWARGSGVRLLAAKKFPYSPKCPDRHWILPRLVFKGNRGSLPVMKWPGFEVDRSVSS
jgi:hypothetical protein